MMDEFKYAITRNMINTSESITELMCISESAILFGQAMLADKLKWIALNLEDNLKLIRKNAPEDFFKDYSIG